MTDRIKGFTVILDHDVREDDFEVYFQSISLMKGVQSVIPYKVTYGDSIIEIRTKNEMKSKIYEVLKDL